MFCPGCLVVEGPKFAEGDDDLFACKPPKDVKGAAAFVLDLADCAAQFGAVSAAPWAAEDVEACAGASSARAEETP